MVITSLADMLPAQANCCTCLVWVGLGVATPILQDTCFNWRSKRDKSYLGLKAQLVSDGWRRLVIATVWTYRSTKVTHFPSSQRFGVSQYISVTLSSPPSSPPSLSLPPLLPFRETPPLVAVVLTKVLQTLCLFWAYDVLRHLPLAVFLFIIKARWVGPGPG